MYLSSHSFFRIRAIIRKEIWHIMRDWQTLMIIIAMPIIIMFLYGYALTMDMKEALCLAQDPQPSVESRSIIRSIDASAMFKVIGTADPAEDAVTLFQKYHVKVILRFRPDFARDLRNGGSPAPIQLLIDGSDPNQATIIKNIMPLLVQNTVLKQMNIEPPKMVAIQPRFLYNPLQKSALFFIPGLMALILMLISAMMTSLTITREKEYGTMEQLLVSPLKPWEIIFGKISPYIALALIDGAVILTVGNLFFGVEVNGSYLFLFFSVLIYVTAALSLGLIFSTVAKNQQQAMLMVLPVTLMPTMLLSGFIFPISSMPLFLRGVAHIVPATYFLQVIRGIILKGVGVFELWQPLAVLAGFGLVFMAISIKKFRIKL